MNRKDYALVQVDKTGSRILRLSPDEKMVLRLEERGGQDPVVRAVKHPQ